MHAVILTPTVEAQAKAAGVSEAELDAMVSFLAFNPTSGDLIPGTGGARKVRFAAPGRGKSGGYRTVHVFAGQDVPLFLLALVSKGQRADLSQGERNALREVLSGLADAYRAGVSARIDRARRS